VFFWVQPPHRHRRHYFFPIVLVVPPLQCVQPLFLLLFCTFSYFSSAHKSIRTMSEAYAYENGKPTVGGPDATIIKCFKDNGNGLLFRITDEEEKIWAFYNDTANYHMIVKANFGKDSEIEAAGKTSMERDAESGEYKCELTIAPMETEVFIKGTPNGFKICYEANPNVGKA